MSVHEIIKILHDYYKDKIDFHLKNLQFIVASFIGILIASNFSEIMTYFHLEIHELIFIYSFPSFYFTIRSRYWSAMLWQVMNITYPQDTNISLGIVVHNCYQAVKINNSKLLFIPLVYSTKPLFKAMFLIIFPVLSMVIFYFWSPLITSP